MAKSKWTILSKKGKNFENLFISLLAARITDSKVKRQDPAELIASHWLQTAGNRYFLTKEYQSHKNRLLGFLKDDPQILIASYEVYLEILKKLEKSADQIPQYKFEQIDLVEYLDQWTFLVKRALQYGYNYYWLSEAVTDIILKALKKNGSKDVFSDFEILSQAEKLSAIQQEKIDILKIVARIDKNNLDINDKIVNNQIASHLEKYDYLGQYYFRAQPWKKEDVVARIKNWLATDWQTEKNKAEHFKNFNKETKELLNKYNFTDYQQQIAVLMKKMSHATNRYDEVHCYYFLKSKNLLTYIKDKIGVNYQELIEMTIDELIDYVKNNKKADKQFRKILVEREKDSFHLAQHGQSQIFVGQQAKDLFLQEISEEVIEDTNVLKGNCACQGKAKGKVVIFKSVEDLNKIKEGNVMVARATVPAFVPAMEKSAAIITEMGGLLSHAAIVSRELKVPCVIGVNNATRILKDGDQVEVDANNGIIEIIK